jgi:3,4-dihydroxy 2-butanone 4-phosphate synthase/GTP cyclohydrolase II
VSVPTVTDRLTFEVETTIPTLHGDFRVRGYRDIATGAEHLALIAEAPGSEALRPGALVRVHSECLTGEALGSLKCDCGPQLDAAMAAVAAEGGVIIYLRGHEGRGIGLLAKLQAYRLQEEGLDTLDANLALGLPADAREYAAAAAILEDLGLDEVRLLTNNPDKIAQLSANGITVLSRVPLLVGQQASNRGYLQAKRDRMGHLL